MMHLLLAALALLIPAPTLAFQAADPGAATGVVTLASPNGVAVVDEESGAINTNSATLGACEDQASGGDTGLCRVSGARVRVTSILSGVTTNTTGAATELFTGKKTIVGKVVGTGSVTATIELFGDDNNDAANGVSICKLVLSGSNEKSKRCSFDRNYKYYYGTTTNVTGTGATVSLNGNS